MKSTEPLNKVSSKHNKIYTGEQIYKNLILSTSKHTHLYFLSLNLEGKLVPNSDITPVSIPETHLAFHHSTFLRMSFLLARRPWGTWLVHLLGSCHSCSNHLFLPMIAEQQDTYSRIIYYLLVSVHDPSSFLLESNAVPATEKHK